MAAKKKAPAKKVASPAKRVASDSEAAKARVAAKAKTDAARRPAIRKPNGLQTPGQTWSKNTTYSNSSVVGAIGKMFVDNNAKPYKTKSGKRMVTGTYKGKGSK
jgi:hypothetical protein